jgi:hypothetical protein
LAGEGLRGQQIRAEILKLLKKRPKKIETKINPGIDPGCWEEGRRGLF